MSVKIELDKSQLDEVVQATISSLEKQVRSLETKVLRRDEKIRKLEGGMDLTKEVRETIRSMADNLVLELDAAGWSKVDLY